MKEMTYSSADLCTKIKESRKLYPDFDFSLLDDDEKYHFPNFFYLYDLTNTKKRRELITLVEKEYRENDEEFDEKAKNALLKWMRENSDSAVESKTELNLRVKNMKNFLNQLITKENPVGEVVLVGHYQIFGSLLAMEFNQKGEFKVVNPLKNCEVRQFTIDLLEN